MLAAFLKELEKINVDDGFLIAALKFIEDTVGDLNSQLVQYLNGSLFRSWLE